MELARDGHVDDFKAAWQHFNLNRGVAFESTDVKFGEQELELEMLYAKQIQALANLYEDEEQARAPAKLHKDEKQAQALAKLYEDEDEEPARALAKLHKDEGPARTLAKFYKDEERARALAKLYEDAKQARALAKLDEDEEQARPLADFMTNVKGHEKKAVTWIYGKVRKIVYDVEHGEWRKKKTQSTNRGEKVEDGAVRKRAKNKVPDRKAKEEVGKADWHVLKVIRNALPAIYPGKNYRKFLDVDTKSNSGWTALHLAVRLKIKEKDAGKKADFLTMIVAIIRFINAYIPESINKSDNTKSTPLHTSVAAGDLELVERLLEDGEKIDSELVDNERRTALEIAVHQYDFRMVRKIQHYRERAGIVCNHQAYADSASAILVGAALLVTVTFAAWVQIPTSDSTLFWVFISLSFYFAVATFISAAGAVIPSKDSTLGLIRRWVLLSAFCLAISLACAVAAFAIAGFLIVPYGIEHQRKVIATTVIGGFVCLFCLLTFVRKIFKALGLFFLLLDIKAQQQLKNCTGMGVKMMRLEPLLNAIEYRYKACFTIPFNKLFNMDDSDLNDGIACCY
ncbi:unnamed protein product [Sphagnum balticum]